MKRSIINLLSSTVLAFALMAMSAPPVQAAPGNPATSGVLPAHSHAFGKSLGEWSAAWWKWYMELPMNGHPGIDSPNFDVSAGQTYKVWFLASPFGTLERACSIPAGKALCIGLLNGEASDIEYGVLTEEDQRAFAKWIADHINSVSCSVDGVPVGNLSSYRVQSPQFSFTAPDPWIFSPSPGGAGTAVADGYFVMLTPLSVGPHTIHIAGSFHFDAGELGVDPADFGLDVIYHLTVE